MNNNILKMDITNFSVVYFTMPAFKILENTNVFKSVKVEHGVIVWDNGEIDIAPEFLYKNSYNYNEIITT